MGCESSDFLVRLICPFLDQTHATHAYVDSCFSNHLFLVGILKANMLVGLICNFWNHMHFSSLCRFPPCQLFDS